jgi:hypothetical protein
MGVYLLSSAEGYRWLDLADDRASPRARLGP